MCVCERLCVCTGIVQNELICGYANTVHTSSSFHPHAHARAHHTHISILSEDLELMGLKL